MASMRGILFFYEDGTYYYEIVDDGETYTHNGTWYVKNGLFYDTSLGNSKLGAALPYELEGDTLTITRRRITREPEVVTLVRMSRH